MMNTELLSEHLLIYRHESAISQRQFCQPQNDIIIIQYLMQEDYYLQIYQSQIGKDDLE